MLYELRKNQAAIPIQYNHTRNKYSGDVSNISNYTSQQQSLKDSPNMEYLVFKKKTIPLATQKTYKNTKSRIDTGLSQERVSSRDVF